MPESDNLLPAPITARVSRGVREEDLEVALTGASRLVAQVFTRSVRDETAVHKRNEKDSVVDVLEKVIHGIKTGENISSSYDEIAKYIANQEARAELISNLLMTHNYDRLVRFIKARATIDNYLCDCTDRGDLSPSEALAFKKLIGDEIANIETQVKAGATNVNDVLSLLNKVDYAVQVSDSDLRDKLSKGTSPQGREIVRKLAHKLNKIAKDTSKKRG